MRSRHYSSLWPVMACLWCVVGWEGASAQMEQERVPVNPPAQRNQTVHYDLSEFTQSDWLLAKIDFSKMKTQYMVGEPIVVPIKLINHTRLAVTVMTNFVPGSDLSVQIRQPGKKPRLYTGAQPVGRYPDEPYPMRPFEECSRELILWADREEPSGLAFSQPGKYLIEPVLKFTIAETGSPGQINLDRFTVTIVPTPPAQKALVDLLSKNQGFVSLQNKNLNLDTLDQLRKHWQDVQDRKIPPSVLTPYISISLGRYMEALWLDNPQDKHLADESLKYLYVTTLSDSAYKLDAYFEMLTLYDRLGLSSAAENVARKILEEMPKDSQGRIGQNKLIKKYLIETDELDPVKYWTFFN